MSISVRQAYSDIEKTISYGFLTVGMSFNGHRFLLKNITDKELDSIDLYKKEENRFSEVLYQISFCTALIDDQNFLVERFSRLPDLVEFYSKLPTGFILKVRETIQTLNEEYLEALKYLEGFCYTDRSRFLWKVFDPRNRDSYTGFSGVNNVGMNSVQENWIVINKRLDEEELYGKELSLSLLVASATNPKGTKVISRNYEFSKRELDELRKDIAKYGYDRKRVLEQKKKTDWTAPLKSREDLVRELYRQMQGKKDKHDLFIEEWINKQRELAEQAKVQAEARQSEFRAKLQQADLSMVEDSKPISTTELNKILMSRKGASKDSPANEFMSSYENNDQRDRFIKKISATVIKPNK